MQQHQAYFSFVVYKPRRRIRPIQLILAQVQNTHRLIYSNIHRVSTYYMWGFWAKRMLPAMLPDTLAHSFSAFEMYWTRHRDRVAPRPTAGSMRWLLFVYNGIRWIINTIKFHRLDKRALMLWSIINGSPSVGGEKS